MGKMLSSGCIHQHVDKQLRRALAQSAGNVYLGRKYPRRVDFLIYTLVEEVELDMISEVKRRAARNGQLTSMQRHMLEKQADEKADDVSDVALSLMIRPNRRVPNTFTVESFKLDGVRYMVTVKFDPNSDAKSIMSCSCPAYTYENLPCKHMFLRRVRRHTGYTGNGDYRPQRLNINLNPSTSNSSPLSDSPNPSNVPSSSSSSHPPSSGPTVLIMIPPLVNPREALKAVINKFKRTFEQSTFPEHRLLEIVGKLEGLHSE